MSIRLFDPELAYARDQNLKKDDVKALIKWVYSQPHLPEINEAQAILFLQRWGYQYQAVRNAVDSYFTFRTLCSDIFLKKYPSKLPVEKSLDVFCITTLPHKTPEGYNILFIKMLDSNIDHFDFPFHMKHWDMAFKTNLYQQGSFPNYVVLMDMNGFPYELLDKLDPLTLKKCLYYLQEIIPLNLKRVHYFNVPPFFEDLMALVKPCFKKELANSLYGHKNVNDLVKYIPRVCLPKDYGGSVDSVSVLHEKIKTTLLENTAFFNWEDKQVVDESKRPENSKIFEHLVTVVGSPQNGSFTFAEVRSEYYKDPKLQKHDVTDLIIWSHSQPHLPKISELQAILFLQKTQYEIEAAKEATDSYFTYKTLHSNVFLKRNPLYSPLKKSVDGLLDSVMTVLPEETLEGNRILFVKMLDRSVENVDFAVHMKYFDMALSLDLYKRGSCKGYIVLADVENLSLSFITKNDPLILKTVFYYLQQIAPVQLKEIHYINLNPYFKDYLSVLQPVVPQKLFWYDSLDDLIKRFPRKCLPENYGGSHESVDTLNEKSTNDLFANVALFDWEDSQTVNETRRSKDSKILENTLAITNSFYEGNQLIFADVESLYRKNKNLKKEDVETIVEWVHNQPHLPETNEIQAILFLHKWHYDVEDAKQALDSYFTYKTFSADIYLGRNPSNPKLKEALDLCLLTVLPKKTPEGYSILFLKLLNLDVNDFDCSEQIKQGDMALMLHLYQEGPSNGFILLIDAQGLPFEIMPKFVPSALKRCFHYFWEVVPLQMKGLHYINTGSLPFANDFADVVRGTTSEEFIEKVYFHKGVEELLKYVPRGCLPEDYGGSVESISVLQEIRKIKFCVNAALFDWEDKQTVDENKRSYKHKTLKDILAIFGPEGNETALPDDKSETEYTRDRNLRKQEVTELIEWVHHQPHLPEINEIQAIRFLQRWHYQLEIAKGAIDSYFTYKTFCSDTFLGRNPVGLAQALGVHIYTVLPKKTSEDYNITFVKILNANVDQFNFATEIKILDMVTMLHLYQEDSSTRSIIVADMQDFPYGIIPKLDPVNMKRLFHYFQEVAPILWNAFHIINPIPFIQEYVNAVKPTLRDGLLDNFYIHNTFDDLLKYVPLELLPGDYGGSQKSLTVLYEKTKRKILANADLFDWEDKQTVEEHLRPDKYKAMKDILAVARSSEKSDVFDGHNEK